MRTETGTEPLFTEETSLSAAMGLLAKEDWVANSIETLLRKRGFGGISVKEARSQ